MAADGLWVVNFKHADETQKATLGGKGAGLAAMTQIGLPVPPGFTITTEACRSYYAADGDAPDGLWAQVVDAVGELEFQTGKEFGGASNPLLLSVRSGSPVSMPGMMDTILDLGMNDETVEGLAALTDDEAFAWDAYRRFIQMYADVVLEVDGGSLHAVLGELRGGERPDAETAKRAVMELKEIVRRDAGIEIPQDPMEQLRTSVTAVFRSWMNRRAVDYRKNQGIPDDLFTAANVQAMVFGNIGDHSGTGVVFTRDPTTGEPQLWGEYLENAQGEDIVAGIRTPLPVASLADSQPEMYDQLVEAARALERYNGDMQDIEFTVENATLWMLQTRRGKRAGRAAVRCAVDMVAEGLIDKEEAVRRVMPSEVDELLHPVVKARETDEVLATGLAASPGGASGIIALTADTAEELAAEGHDVILVRDETSPDDFHGMVASKAVVTARGGMTSHAAVVARGMGMCCVVGCSDLRIDDASGTVTAGTTTIAVGDRITVDGTTGKIYIGDIPTAEASQDEYFDTLLDWATEIGGLSVRANADTPEDARTARGFGVEGIGLCRTEHMFFEHGRIEAVREMIMADDPEARAEAINKIEPFQTADFEAIFTAMDGLPVTVRLLDPPLHEFLPNRDETFEELTRLEHQGAAADPASTARVEELQLLLTRTDRLKEVNPMLGHRGVRLGIAFPEITVMQVKAILTAAITCRGNGVDVKPEIMVPLVGFVNEFLDQKQVIVDTANAVFDEHGTEVDYLIGSMIEVPRAALTAGEIAHHADFISFGTNDLTQTALGLSRDDSSRFLPTYVARGIFDSDPFVELDLEGVGKLISIAVEASRAAKPGIKVGVCGEHGGNPRSVEFFASLGIDYVSCSPYRVPAARLSTAKATISG